jgi:type IV secretion system protein VirB10
MTDHEPLSAVFAREPKPQVSQPSSPWTVILGIGGCVVLGAVVFGSLSSARQAHAAAAQPKPTASTPPAWGAGVAQLAQSNAGPPPAPIPQTAPQQQPVAAAVPPPTDPDPSEPHWRAPAVVVDLSEAGPAVPQRLAQAQTAAPAAGPAGAPVAGDGPNAEERFAARIAGGGAETAHATQMRDLSRTVPQGFVIPAVLETAIDSDLPGSVRAVVSRDVRGFDGSQVLIPRGSKLIGQYKSAAAIGQTRAFVVWTRIITPAGVSIDVGSPATDRLGRGGLEGKADDHFFKRFGASILLSVISAGTEAIASQHSGSNTALIIGSPTQAQNVASIALQKQIDIPTTIRVAQGVPVQVSVARDLDFSAVAPR